MEGNSVYGRWLRQPHHQRRYTLDTKFLQLPPRNWGRRADINYGMQDNGWLLSRGEKLRLQIFFLPPPYNFTFLHSLQ